MPRTWCGPPSRKEVGYRLVTTDGEVFERGSLAYCGGLNTSVLPAQVVSMASTPDGRGYWLLLSDGAVYAFGDATWYGDLRGSSWKGGPVPPGAPAVGIAATPDGKGYLVLAADGSVYAFGDATYHGSRGGEWTDGAPVGIAVDAKTGGYWVVTSKGAVYGEDAPTSDRSTTPPPRQWSASRRRPMGTATGSPPSPARVRLRCRNVRIGRPGTCQLTCGRHRRQPGWEGLLDRHRERPDPALWQGRLVRPGAAGSPQRGHKRLQRPRRRQRRSQPRLARRRPPSGGSTSWLFSTQRRRSRAALGQRSGHGTWKDTRDAVVTAPEPLPPRLSHREADRAAASEGEDPVALGEEPGSGSEHASACLAANVTHGR